MSRVLNEPVVSIQRLQLALIENNSRGAVSISSPTITDNSNPNASDSSKPCASQSSSGVVSMFIEFNLVSSPSPPVPGERGK